MNGWVNNGEAGDWRRHHAHYDVTVMYWKQNSVSWKTSNNNMMLFVPYIIVFLIMILNTDGDTAG